MGVGISSAQAASKRFSYALTLGLQKLSYTESPDQVVLREKGIAIGAESHLQMKSERLGLSLGIEWLPSSFTYQSTLGQSGVVSEKDPFGLWDLSLRGRLKISPASWKTRWWIEPGVYSWFFGFPDQTYGLSHLGGGSFGLQATRSVLFKREAKLKFGIRKVGLGLSDLSGNWGPYLDFSVQLSKSGSKRPYLMGVKYDQLAHEQNSDALTFDRLTLQLQKSF